MSEGGRGLGVVLEGRWGAWTATGLVRWERNSWAGREPSRTRMEGAVQRDPEGGSPLAERTGGRRS